MSTELSYWASLAVFLVFAVSPDSTAPLAVIASEGADDEGKDGGEDRPGGGEDEKGGPKAGDDEEEPPEEPQRPQLTEREKQVLGLFNASSRSFKDGRLVLVYNFEVRKDEQLEDWKPSLEEARSRIRWSLPQEGPRISYVSPAGVRGTRYQEGIVLADFGQWLHKAVFLPDVEVSVELLNYAQPRQGSLLCPVFFSEKKRSSIGVNDGYQAVCLNGWKPARPADPRTEKPIPFNVRHQVGYRLKGKSFEFYRGEKRTGDTSASPKFTEGYDTGHVGFAWNGSIRGFIFRVTITGQLDPDWISAELGEKPDAGRGKKAAGR